MPSVTQVAEFARSARLKGFSDEDIITTLRKDDEVDGFIAAALSESIDSKTIIDKLVSRGAEREVKPVDLSNRITGALKETGRFFVQDVLKGAGEVLAFVPKTIAREVATPFVGLQQGIKGLRTGRIEPKVKVPVLGDVGAPESPREALGRAAELTAATGFGAIRGAQVTSGAITGALYGGGGALREEKPLGEVALRAGIGAAAGAAITGVAKLAAIRQTKRANELVLSGKKLSKQEARDVAREFQRAVENTPDDVKKAANFNLEKWRELGPKKVVYNVAEAMKPGLTENNRGVMTAADIAKLAENIGVDMSPGRAAEIASKHANLAEEIGALRVVFGELSDDVDRSLRAGVASSWDDASVAQFRRSLGRMYEFTPSVSRVTAEWGRAGTAFKSMVSGEEAKALMRMGDASKFSDDAVRALGSYLNMLSAGEGSIGTTKAALTLMDRSATEKFVDFWVGTRLLNPLTHGRNLTGNTIKALTTDFERGTAGGIDTVVSKLQGREKELYASDGIQSAFGRIEGFRGVLKTITEAVRAGKNPSDALVERYPAISAGRYAKFEEVLPKGMLARGALKVSNAPGYALQYEDLIFRAMAYEASIRAQANQATHKLGDISIDAFGEAFENLVRNPSPQMVKKASLDAAGDVYQQQLGKFAQDINKIRVAHPPTRLIVPFFKTIVNIAKNVVTRIPVVGLATPSERAALKAGGAEVSNVLARQLTGTIGALTLVSLANAGYITGRGPKSINQRAALERTGWRPYSVKVGDMYISIRGFDPITTPASLAAEMVEGFRDAKAKNEPPTALVTKLIASFVRNMADQPFLLGLDQLLDAIQQPEQYADRYVKSFIAGILGNPLVSATARTIDTTVRRPNTFAERMLAPIPGLSKQVPASRTPFAEEKKRAGRLWSGLILPQASRIERDQIDDEMERLGFYVGYPGTVGPAGIKFTKDEQDQILVRSGPRIKDRVLDIIDDPSYVELGDPDKIKVWKRVIDEERDQARVDVLPYAWARTLGVVDPITEAQAETIKKLITSKGWGKLKQEQKKDAIKRVLNR